MSLHPIDAHALPGIGPLRRTRLAEAGIDTLEDLLAAPPERLLGLPGFTTSVVDRARAAADAVLAGSPPPIPRLVELVADEAGEARPADAPRPRLQRGLDLARRLEAAQEWVGRAREHARALPKGKVRSRLRRQLGKLADVIGAAQKEAIARGASPEAARDLGGLIEGVERELRAWVVDPPTEARGRALRRSAKAARQELDDRIQ